MASRSDSFQNIPMSPFCDLENVFCDIKFIDLNGGGGMDRLFNTLFEVF